jgi:hypothetical protein
MRPRNERRLPVALPVSKGEMHEKTMEHDECGLALDTLAAAVLVGPRTESLSDPQALPAGYGFDLAIHHL